MSQDDLTRALIGSMMTSETSSESSDTHEPATPENLIAALKLYNKKYAFSVGDLVTWKPNMRNRRWPEYGEPAIVMEVLDEPRTDEREEQSSPYYAEPLDIKLGIVRDSDFLLFMYCSKRLMPYKANTSTKKKRKLQIEEDR